VLPAIGAMTFSMSMSYQSSDTEKFENNPLSASCGTPRRRSCVQLLRESDPCLPLLIAPNGHRRVLIRVDDGRRHASREAKIAHLRTTRAGPCRGTRVAGITLPWRRADLRLYSDLVVQLADVGRTNCVLESAAESEALERLPEAVGLVGLDTPREP
jgi:hypothetical protein